MLTEIRFSFFSPFVFVKNSIEEGGGKRSRFLNRLFPWRSSSTQRSSSGSRMLMHKDSAGQLFASSSTSSVRRTSPVDLNLGGDSSVTSPLSLVGPPPCLLVAPSSLPIPRFPDVIEPEPSATILPSHLRRTRLRHREGGTTGFRMPTAAVDRPPTPQQIDREEMSALRHLASELHAALRLSEEENLLLKGNTCCTTLCSGLGPSRLGYSFLDTKIFA